MIISRQPAGANRIRISESSPKASPPGLYRNRNRLPAKGPAGGIPRPAWPAAMEGFSDLWAVEATFPQPFAIQAVAKHGCIDLPQAWEHYAILQTRLNRELSDRASI